MKLIFKGLRKEEGNRLILDLLGVDVSSMSGKCMRVENSPKQEESSILSNGDRQR